MLGFSLTACDQCVVFGMPKDEIPRLRPLIQLPEQLVFEITPIQRFECTYCRCRNTYRIRRAGAPAPRLTASYALIENSEAMTGFLFFGQKIQRTQGALRRECSLQQQTFFALRQEGHFEVLIEGLESPGSPSNRIVFRRFLSTSRSIFGLYA